MGNDVGGLAVGPYIGVIFVGLLLLGTLFSVIVAIGRSRTKVLDATDRVYADVETGLALLEVRVEQLAGALAAPEAADGVGRGVADGVGGNDTGAQAAQALADARDRLTAARQTRAESRALPVSLRCRRTVLEGLAAVHAGDRLASRDPGPEPPSPTAATLVGSPVRVAVDGREHIALPAYAPGFRYCYSGGVFDVAEVPGGWYAEPFWEQLLAAGAAASEEPRPD